MRGIKSDIQVAVTGCLWGMPSAHNEAVLSDLMIIIIEDKLKLL